jgi:hypothetical protein
MNRSVYFILIIFLFVSCQPKEEKVEKFMENEVEVVVNYIEPYKIKGETFALNLEEEFRIDMERDDILEAGLADARKFGEEDKKRIQACGDS